MIRNMKRYFLLIIVVSTISSCKAQEVFCRYEYKSDIHYGKVINNKIKPLDKAPWKNGQPVGRAIAIKKVKLLHPSEPKVILGLGKSYIDSWKGDKPYNTVRWFLKPPSAAASPGQDIVLPFALDKIKVEVELVIVIGKKVKDANEDEAEKAIFGYTLGNDIVGDVNSYHELQGEPADQKETLLAPGLKIGDNFSPFGPFIYTNIDWKGRQRELTITDKEGNEKVHYVHNTSNMAYTPAKMVSDLSKILTLSPGDIIMSGTSKSFVAEAGDIVEISVEGIGTLLNKVVQKSE